MRVKPLLGALVLFVSLVYVCEIAWASTDTSTKVVFYLNQVDSIHQMRVFDPSSSKDRLLHTFQSKPKHVMWDEDYERIYFRVGREVFSSEWDAPLSLVKRGRLPDSIPVGADFGRFSDTGPWHALGIQRKTDVDQPGIFWEVILFEFTFSGRAKQVLSKVIQCELSCSRVYRDFDRVNEFLDNMRSYYETLGELRERMGAEAIFERHEAEPWGGEGPPFLSLFGEHIGVKFDIAVAESAHVMGPIHWVNTKGNTEKLIYEETSFDGDHQGHYCSNQAMFQKEGRFLLVTDESGGQCGRVINLGTGSLVKRLPGFSSNAVWVPGFSRSKNGE